MISPRALQLCVEVLRLNSCFFTLIKVKLFT